MMSRSFTKREKILLLVLCVLLLSVLYYQFIYKTTEAVIEKYDTGDLEIDLMAEQTKAVNIMNMEAEIEVNTDSDNGVVSSYNNIKGEITQLNDIFDRASNYNFEFGKAIKDGDAVRRNISVSFTAGSYATAKNIIKDLHNCKYRCLIRNISISASENGINSGEVSVTLSVTFFETMYNANSSNGLEEAVNDKETTTEKTE